MYLVTGATGAFGRAAIHALLASGVPASRIVAAARRPEAAADLAALGVQVRHADYTQPATLDAAFAGVERALLVSSSAVGRRVGEHGNVIASAARAGVALLAYTSILHADRSPLALASEHRETEALLAASGLPHVLLRNGWYAENYYGRIAAAAQQGRLPGCTGSGRMAPAARADYAAAAAAVLLGEAPAGQVYELAGDRGFTLAELAAAIARRTGRTVVAEEMAPARYEASLVASGIPAGFAHVLADSDAGVAAGALCDDRQDLGRLLGRPTLDLEGMLDAALPA